MADRFKGITIEIDGNTTKLEAALKKVDRETKSLDKELRKVDKALRFNPTSVSLWSEKQKLLSQQVDNTKNKLDRLKQAQAQMDASKVDKNSEQYRNLQREIALTNTDLQKFERELRKIGNVNLKVTAEQFKDIGNKLTAAGQAMQGLSVAAAAVAASIGAVTVKSASWADDINTMSKVYGIGTKELQQYSVAAELVDVDVETIAKSHSKLTKAMNSASSGTGASAEAFEKLGVSVTNSDGSLRDADTVWQETIKALGKVSNETERDAIAMQLMGKSAQELNPLIEDGGKTYKELSETLSKYGLDFIDQETLDQANEFNDALDTIKAIGMVAFQQIGTQLAAYLAPVLEKVVDLVGKLSEWFTNLSPETQALVAGIAGLVAVLSPLLIGIGKVAFAISSIINVVNMAGASIGALASPIGIAIAVIAALVTAGILLYKNWDTIKAKAIAFKNAVIATFNQFKAAVVAQFNAIKTAIVTPIQNAINTVKGIINRIKGFFPISVGKIFSGIKLPHFKISGKLSVSPPSVPKISIDWYKTGGIFDSPSLIGVGEAGPEAVVPLDKFWEKLDNLNGETNIVINVNGANKNPIEIAEEVKRILIKETNQRRLAWQ